MRIFLKKFIIKKRLGQNFLININLVKKILNFIKINIKDILIEIGPGFGVLTKKLMLLTKNFVCIEIDKKLVIFLKKYILKNKNMIINMNILKYKLKFNKKVIIIGNIPYYITKKIFYWIIKYKDKIKKIICLLQQELIYTFLKKKNKLSVILQTFFKIKLLLKINKYNFFPIPNVNSILIMIIPIKRNIKINKYILFLKQIFIKKRKKIYNSLNLNKYKYISFFNKRIEEISIKKIIFLYKFLFLKNYV